MIDNRIKLDKVHTVKLIKPTRPYGKNIIETLDSKIFMQPIVINNGLPINPAVWNICYFNKKYNTNLVIRCIVPVNMETKIVFLITYLDLKKIVLAIQNKENLYLKNIEIKLVYLY